MQQEEGETFCSEWRQIIWAAAFWIGKRSRTWNWWTGLTPLGVLLCFTSVWNLEEQACDSPCLWKVRCCHPSASLCLTPNYWLHPILGSFGTPTALPTAPLPLPSHPRLSSCSPNSITSPAAMESDGPTSAHGWGSSWFLQPLDRSRWLKWDRDGEGEELRILLRPPPGTGGTSTNAQWTAKSYIIDLSDVFAYK